VQTTAVETIPQPAPVERGQNLILHGVSWETYERLLADFQDSHAAHFAYDQGVLEIMVLSAEHERPNRTIALLVEEVALEMGIDVDNVGSHTFKREDLARGFEPDTCFYIQNAERVSGKARIDLAVDPPPDLVIEIDITHPSLEKLPLYAAAGVPEVWRYADNVVTIYCLEESSYQSQEVSKVLPGVMSQVLSQFMEASISMKRTAWIRRVREWARELAD
jgi:Uma2 family endonuclease